MAGHTSEKRWRANQNRISGNVGVSELASAVCVQMIDALTISEAAFAELQELYIFNGSTLQGLADQLFYEDWVGRGTLGTKAVVTVDISSGVISNPIITTAGTAYVDGTGLALGITQTAGGGDLLAVLTYDVVSGAWTNPAIAVGGTTYVDGTGVSLLEVPISELVLDTQANAEELAKASDLFDAITALHELHQAANNTAVVTEDRYAQIRRMS